MSLRARGLLLLFVALALGEAPARAYVQTRTKYGTALRWPMSCIVISPDARGDTSASEIDNETIEETLRRAIANWNSRIGDCSYMRIGVAPSNRALEPVSDGRPSLVFRAERWGRGDRDYPPSAIGRTTVWFNTNGSSATDGVISDADIELNAVNYTFTTRGTDATPVPGTTLADLENTLTHEIGHMLGLGHTCVASDDVTDESEAVVDHLNSPVPSCALGSSLPAEIRNATMYPYADPGSTSMRILSDDDVRGVCDPYPSSSPATACYGFIEGAGCAATRRPGGSPAAWLLILGAVLVTRTRSRRDRLGACRSAPPRSRY